MLCQFSQAFPPFVERFLEQSRRLDRSFREETITDILMGGLISADAAMNRVIVQFPNETVTGADMEWQFVDRRTHHSFAVMLQAKRAEGNGRKWARHSYKHLYHKARTATALQIDTLCKNASAATTPTYPLYIFYNPALTASLARRAGKVILDGANIADGYAVRHLAKLGLAAKRSYPYQQLGKIEPLLNPLSTLFCPDSFRAVSPIALLPPSPLGPFYLVAQSRLFASIEPPSPETVRNRLVQLRNKTVEFLRAAEGDDVSYEPPGVPEVSIVTDPSILRLMDRSRYSGDPDEEPERLDRWRVVFVSNGGSPLEDRESETQVG